MTAFRMTTSAWRRTLVAGVATLSLAAALPASAGPLPIAAARAVPMAATPAVGGAFDGASIVKVRNGRNATAAAIAGGIAVLGLGAAAIASQNRSYGGGYYGGSPGYYAPSNAYYAPSGGYYGAPAYAYEEPAPVYVEPAPVYVDPGPVYATPAYGYGYGYGPRYPRRHHAGGPGKRSMDNFRDSYR
jgi:hypothetical protein